MSTVSCPLCNKTVNINNINSHIDSNCTLHVTNPAKTKKKLRKTQSDLTQYFHKKSKTSNTTFINTSNTNNSKKRKREENDEYDNTESPNKRIKLSLLSDNKESMEIDEKEKEDSIPFKYEQFECKNKSCIPLLNGRDNDINIDVECMYFDQHIVGQKFCKNKSYKKYKLNRKHIDNKYCYLDLVHEHDNIVDNNACIIVQCQLTEKDNISIIGLGYLPKTISQYVADLINNDNVDIDVYAIDGNNERIEFIRIHICISSKPDDIEEIMNKITNLNVILNKNNGKNDLYFNILSNIFVSCFKKYSHLFQQNQLDLLSKMIDLKDNKKTNDAIKLLSRLILRKVKWFKINCLSYHEITDIQNAVSILIKYGILIESQQFGVTQDLLNCVGKDILIRLSNKTGFKVKKTWNGINCDELIKSIIHEMDTQKTIFGVKLSKNATFLKKCHSIIGKFISISDIALDLLNKCQLLFYLDPRKRICETVLADIGQRRYPKYKIFNDECKEDTIIFPTKQIFHHYIEALQFKSEYEEIYNQYTKNNMDESELIEIIKNCAKKLTEKIKQQNASQITNDNIHSFVSKYRDITIYAKIIHRGVNDVIEKLTDKQHKLCCNIYQQLLSAQRYSYNRGQWFCRLALLLHHHLKQYKLAYTVCCDGLNDDYVEIADRNQLIKRYRKLHKLLDLKKKLKIPIPKSSCFALNDGEEFIDSKKFKYIIIGGKPVNREVGEKSRFFGFDDNIVSVEELVIQYFEDKENGSWNGIHCEGSIYKMIFTIFMWHIIFNDDISNVFQTQYQDAPLDIYSEWFYLNRKELIQQYIDEILSHFNNQDIENKINNIYLNHYGECVIGIYWDRFDLNQFISICKSIGGYGIAQICLLLAKNYKYWNGGLPDLLLWKKVNDDKFKCKIVEVKGPRDTLSEKQKCWILYLKKYAKLDVCVAKIKQEF